jgi:hypothetical protein
MLKHLDVVPPRRTWRQRIGWWRDLSQLLALRGVPDEGDLVVETDVCVAVDDAERVGWTLPSDIDSARRRLGARGSLAPGPKLSRRR